MTQTIYTDFLKALASREQNNTFGIYYSRFAYTLDESKLLSAGMSFSGALVDTFFFVCLFVSQTPRRIKQAEF